MTDNGKRGSNGGRARDEKLTKEEKHRIASEAAKARWAEVRRKKADSEKPKVDPVVAAEETGIHAEDAGLEPTVWPTYGGIDRSMPMIAPNINPPAVPFQAIPVTTTPAIVSPPYTYTEKRCPACLAGQSLGKGEGTHVIGTSEHPIHPTPTPSEPPPIFIPPPTLQSPPEKPQKSSKRQAKPIPKEFKSASSYAERRLPQAIKEKSDHVGSVARLDAEINDLVRVIRALGGNVDPQAVQPQNYSNPVYNPNAGAPYMPQFPQPTIPDAMHEAPGIDPALYQANSGPVPRANFGVQQAEMIPGTPSGGTEDLPWVTH